MVIWPTRRPTTHPRLCCDDARLSMAWARHQSPSCEAQCWGINRRAHCVHITQPPADLDEVPKDRTSYIFCGSGLRSMTAASLLQREGWTDLVVVLGGTAGWSASTCPLE